MVEIQVRFSRKPCHYKCELCNTKLIPGSVVPHLMGAKHITNFFVSIALLSEECNGSAQVV